MAGQRSPVTPGFISVSSVAAFCMLASFLHLGLLCTEQKCRYLALPVTRQKGAPKFCLQVQKSQGRVDWLRLGQERISEPLSGEMDSVLSPKDHSSLDQ